MSKSGDEFHYRWRIICMFRAWRELRLLKAAELLDMNGRSETLYERIRKARTLGWPLWLPTTQEGCSLSRSQQPL